MTCMRLLLFSCVVDPSILSNMQHAVIRMLLKFSWLQADDSSVLPHFESQKYGGLQEVPLELALLANASLA